MGQNPGIANLVILEMFIKIAKNILKGGNQQLQKGAFKIRMTNFYHREQTVYSSMITTFSYIKLIGKPLYNQTIIKFGTIFTPTVIIALLIHRPGSSLEDIGEQESTCKV